MAPPPSLMSRLCHKEPAGTDGDPRKFLRMYEDDATRKEPPEGRARLNSLISFGFRWLGELDSNQHWRSQSARRHQFRLGTFVTQSSPQPAKCVYPQVVSSRRHVGARDERPSESLLDPCLTRTKPAKWALSMEIIDLSPPGYPPRSLIIFLRERKDGRIAQYYARRLVPPQFRNRPRNPYLTKALGVVSRERAKKTLGNGRQH
jgi:hypothetical protein